MKPARRMSLYPVAIWAVALAGHVCLATAQPPAAPAVAPPTALPQVPVKVPLRPLFIGNSLTYGYSLPTMVAEMFRSRKQQVPAAMLAKGGASLGSHMAEPETLQKVTSAKWSHVILQEQSAVPAVAPGLMTEPAAKLCDAVRKSGAEPVFFITWAYRDQKGTGMDTLMQHQLNTTYAQVAKANHARIAPVGPAWMAVLGKLPDAPLYGPDGQHPAPDGTYLAACVFYAVLANQSPVGLPGKITARNPNGRMTLLADVPVDRAKLYQQGAWHVVRNVTIDTLLDEAAKNPEYSPAQPFQQK